MAVSKKPADAGAASALQTIADALTARPKASIQVGIRNICGSTIGLPAWSGEPSISLHPWNPVDPNSVAVVSQARWNHLKKSGLYNLGLLERFDECLDETASRAPEDRPQDCAPDHAKNALADPRAFLDVATELEIREKITGMTCENNLHRILATVDAKIRELQAQFRVEGDRDPSRRALNELPVNFASAERIAQWRLEQVSPPRDEELAPPKRSL